MFLPCGKNYISAPTQILQTLFMTCSNQCWQLVSPCRMRDKKDSWKKSRMRQPQKEQLVLLLLLICIFIWFCSTSSWYFYRRLLWWYHPKLLSGIMALLVHKCVIRAVSLQAFISQDGRIPHELHLHILSYQPAMANARTIFMHTRGHGFEIVSNVFWRLLCHDVVCTLFGPAMQPERMCCTNSVACLQNLHNSKISYFIIWWNFSLKPVLWAA